MAQTALNSTTWTRVSPATGWSKPTIIQAQGENIIFLHATAAPGAAEPGILLIVNDSYIVPASTEIWAKATTGARTVAVHTTHDNA